MVPLVGGVGGDRQRDVRGGDPQLDQPRGGPATGGGAVLDMDGDGTWELLVPGTVGAALLIHDGTNWVEAVALQSLGRVQGPAGRPTSITPACPTWWW